MAIKNHKTSNAWKTIMTIKTLDLVNVENKTVMVRVDFNVPMKNGKITDATRIVESLPTLLELYKKGARVILISHLGRPKGKDPELSLRPVAEELQRHFKDITIHFSTLEDYTPQKPGIITLLENLRFYPEEEQDDATFAQKFASLADIYVNDAFSVSPRAPRFAPDLQGFLKGLILLIFYVGNLVLYPGIFFLTVFFIKSFKECFLRN